MIYGIVVKSVGLPSGENTQPLEEASKGSMGPFHTLDEHSALSFTGGIKGHLVRALPSVHEAAFPYFAFPGWVCSGCLECFKATFFPLPEGFTALSAGNWETEPSARGWRPNRERGIISSGMATYMS